MKENIIFFLKYNIIHNIFMLFYVVYVCQMRWSSFLMENYSLADCFWLGVTGRIFFFWLTFWRFLIRSIIMER